MFIFPKVKSFALWVLAAFVFYYTPLFGEQSPSIPSSVSPYSTPRAKKPKITPEKVAKRPARIVAKFLLLDEPLQNKFIKNFNFKRIKLFQAVKLINQWTLKHFVLDRDVSEIIDIDAPKELTVQEAYLAFLSAVLSKNLSVKPKGNQILIYRPKKFKPTWIETDAKWDFSSDTAVTTQIWRLKYVKAKVMGEQFVSLLPDGVLFTHSLTNTIIATDTRKNLLVLQEILDVVEAPQIKITLFVISFDKEFAKDYVEGLDEKHYENVSKEHGPLTLSKPTSELPAGGKVDKIILHERLNSILVLADKPGVASVLTQIREVRRSDIFWASPSLAFGIPTGFGAQWGNVFAGVAFFGGNDVTNKKDLILSAGFGLGNPQKNVGVTLVFLIYDVFDPQNDNLALEEYGMGIKFHRYLGDGYSVAIGKANVFFTGVPEDIKRDDTYHLSLSKFIAFKNSSREWLSALLLTAGIGNERFLPLSKQASGEGGVNFFAGAGLRVIGPLAVIAEWKGYDIDLAISITPIRTINLVFNVGIINVLSNAAGGPQLLATGGLGFDFN